MLILDLPPYNNDGNVIKLVSMRHHPPFELPNPTELI